MRSTPRNVGLVIGLLAAGSAQAKHGSADPACAPGLEEGAECSASVADLMPCQLTYGKIEVDRRSSDIAAMSDAKLQKYLKKHLATIVIGPAGRLYITDGHHLALAVAEALGDDTTVYGTVLHDWSRLSAADFWQAMQTSDLIHLYDAQGQGPLPLTSLPDSIFGLSDDPYRSLAWGVRKDGGYDDSTDLFADFRWADFFRNRIDVGQIIEDFDAAAQAGVPLAESAEAADLPGFHGPQ